MKEVIIIMKNILTCCILAKNEENTLKECIESVLDFVDEIILVDNGSVDKTVDIAKNYNAKVISIPHAIESDLRNAYIENCSSEWILVLDADERFQKESYKMLKDKIINDTTTDIFYLPLHNYYGKGKWSVFFKDILFRNKKSIRYRTSTIHPGLIKENHTVDILWIPVHHLDALIKQRSIEKRAIYMEKIQTFISDNPESNSILSPFLGMEYTAMGEFEKAEIILKNCISDNQTMHPRLQTRIFNFLSQNALLMGDLNAANTYANQILQLPYNSLWVSYKINALVIQAKVDLKKNNIERCISYCEQAIADYPLLANNYINLAYLISKTNYARARQLLETAINLNTYLKKQIIYNEGAQPNIYSQQSVLFDDMDIKALLIEHHLYI